MLGCSGQVNIAKSYYFILVMAGALHCTGLAGTVWPNNDSHCGLYGFENMGCRIPKW